MAYFSLLPKFDDKLKQMKHPDIINLRIGHIHMKTSRKKVLCKLFHMALLVLCGLYEKSVFTVNASGSGSHYRLFAECIVSVLGPVYAFEMSSV